MRILVVGAIQGGSVPMCRTMHRAFSDMGQEADLLDFSIFQEELAGIRTDTEQSYQFHLKIKILLLEKVAGFQPEVIFGIAQAPLLDSEMLAGFRKAGIKVCFWFMEDYRIFGYWKKIAPWCDHFFTIQQEPFWQELRDAGCMNYHYLPTAFDAQAGSPEEEQGDVIPSSFVGAPYPNRVHFFRRLPPEGFQIYGEDWNRYPLPPVVIGDRRISEDEAHQIYRRSLININLHSSPFPGEFGGGDFVNPRTFELAGLGAFQLTDMRKLLTLHFDPGDEVIGLNSWEEMKMAAEYFLEHDAERRAFAERARARVLKEHTYRHRAAEVIAILNEGGGPLDAA